MLCGLTDLIWRKTIPFEAMTGRTAPSSDGLLAEGLPTSGTCTYRGSGMAPTVGLLGAKRVLRGVRGQDDATETGRRATPQRIVDIARNRTLK